MKLPQNKSNLTYSYNNIDIKQALTKFSNLIRLYPYHPTKSKIENIGWLTPQKFFRISDIPKKPFCGIIEILHREGFPLYSDWLDYTENLKLKKKNTIQIRNKLVNHLNELLKNIGYNEENARIIVNNKFKELSIWIKVIYEKINYLNEKGGWSSEFIQQSIRRKEIGDVYKQYRKTKAKRMEKKVDQYHKRLMELMNDEGNDNLIPISFRYYEKKRKLPKNPSEETKLRWKLERMEYNSDLTKSLYDEKLPLEILFTKIFHFKHNLNETNIISPEEFDNLFNEILVLIGHDWVSCINGELMLIGYSIEEKEEREVFRYIKRYPKVIENLENAKKHLLEADWNSVPLYCCKTIEHFYKNLLGQKKEFEKLALYKLTGQIINDKNINSLFKQSKINIKGGIKNLMYSGNNLVGTLRNKKDSAHGNPFDVEEWEAKLSYSYTILLLRTLELIKS